MFNKECFISDLSNFDINLSEFHISDFKYQQVNDTNILLVIDHLNVSQNYNITQSLTAFDAGYHCLHVFDWDDTSKLVRYINNERVVDFEDCIMCGITRDYAETFYDENSLVDESFQKDAVYYGIYYNREIILSFGINNTNAHHSLVCMCCKLGVTIKNLDELFKLIKDFSIICDISKANLFYLVGIGLKYISIVEPRIHWVETEKSVIKRYDCGKIILQGKY